jgi:hypothetical protein
MPMKQNSFLFIKVLVKGINGPGNLMLCDFIQDFKNKSVKEEVAFVVTCLLSKWFSS